MSTYQLNAILFMDLMIFDVLNIPFAFPAVLCQVHIADVDEGYLGSAMIRKERA